MAKRKVENDQRGEQFRRIAPGSKMTPVTPNDTTDNLPPDSTLFIGGSGSITFLPEDNEDADTVTIVVADGTFIDQVTVRRVLDTGTDATEIFAVS